MNHLRTTDGCCGNRGKIACLLTSIGILAYGLGMGTGFVLFHPATLNLAPQGLELFSVTPPQSEAAKVTACPPAEDYGECATCPPDFYDTTFSWRKNVDFFTSDRHAGTFVEFYARLAKATNLERCTEVVKNIVEGMAVKKVGRMSIDSLLPYSYESFSGQLTNDVAVFVKDNEFGEFCEVTSVLVAPPVLSSETLDIVQLPFVRQVHDERRRIMREQLALITGNEEAAKLLKMFYSRPEPVQNLESFMINTLREGGENVTTTRPTPTLLTASPQHD